MNNNKGKEITQGNKHTKIRLKPKKIAKRIIVWSAVSLISSLTILYIFIFIFPALPISEGPIAKLQAYAYSSKKIAYKALLKQDTVIEGNSAHTIVSTIVKKRTKNNYLYTGGHYTDFYIRNLGTFANKLLDPQAAQNPDEWIERLKLVTRSTELALGVFESYNEITTTIVQLENGKYVPINVYVEPSDSLASLLKVIHQLQKIDQAQRQYKLDDQQLQQLLIIKNQGYTIEAKYEKFLKQQSEIFVDKYSDSDDLIKRNIALSGIKDSWIRHSSFYDNVMLWSVYHYAYELGLKPEWKQKPDMLKNKLLTLRWDDRTGIFYDEDPQSACIPSSEKNICTPYFSADNLIAYEMGMLHPNDISDRYYLNRIISYIQQKKLDQPLPLKTTEIRIPSKEHLPVRLFAPNYTGTTIWSYWGMVYIDLLNTIGQIENNNTKTDYARQYLQEYEKRIVKYKGFPELYSETGDEYRLFFYRSVNDMVWGIYYLYLENKVATASTNS